MKKQFVLASASPRRREILKMMGINAVVLPAAVKELKSAADPAELVLKNAQLKATTVATDIEKAIIISADTIVVCEEEILGKPKYDVDAFKMLKKLQGKMHSVLTAIVVIDKYNGEMYYNVDETKVYFAAMTDSEIWEYVKTKEPLDKAGGYGIQGIGGKYIERIEGDYGTVVGLSQNKLNAILKKIMAK